MRKYIFILLILSLSITFAFARKGQITCSGSTTVLPIAQAAAEAYMDTHPDLNISVRGGGSGVGIASLQNGTVQIANSSRPIKSKEIAACKAKGINPSAYAVANDGIAIVVHKNNPVREITVALIKDIYTGKISNWKDLGGMDMPIVIVSRDVASGTFEVFNEKALNGAKVVASAQLLASNNAVISAVGSTPGAIGYAGLGYINDSVNVLRVDGVMPDIETVQNGSYKLARKLYMYTNGKAKGAVGNFIGWLQSPAGQKLVEEQGFISIIRK